MKAEVVRCKQLRHTCSTSWSRMKPVLSIKCAVSFFPVVTSFSTWFTGPISSWDHLENTLPTNKHEVIRFFRKDLTLYYKPNGRVTHNNGLVRCHSWFISNCLYVWIEMAVFFSCNENHGSCTKWKNYKCLLSSKKYIQVSVYCDETVEFIDYDGKMLCRVSCSTSTPHTNSKLKTKINTCYFDINLKFRITESVRKGQKQNKGLHVLFCFVVRNNVKLTGTNKLVVPRKKTINFGLQFWWCQSVEFLIGWITLNDDP